jgi:hypothetical protein
MDIDMTNEEINKIIAEFRGWVMYHPTPERISKGYPSYSYWVSPRDSKQSFENWGKLEMDYPPDYCNNLNEMHDAEKYILDFSRFGDELAKVVLGYTGTPEDITLNYWALQRVTHANGRQRAEAFVKTIGKWKK